MRSESEISPMLRRKHLLMVSILWVFSGISMTAMAQGYEAEHDKRVAAAMELLARGNETGQATALSQLAQLLPPEQGVPIFQAHLERHTKSSEEIMGIRNAVEGLAQYGAQARTALPDLIRLLDEVGTVEGEATNGGQVYWWLTTALSRIGPNDPAAVEALKRAVRRSTENPDKLDLLLRESATALGHMGKNAHSAAPALTLALQRCPPATSQVVWALSRMMPEATLSVPTMIRALEAGRDPEAVIDALGAMGPPAKSALPTLHRSLTLPSPLTEAKAFAAIAHIEGEPALDLPGALTALQQLDPRRLAATHAAFETIRQQKAKAKEAIPTLSRIVANRSEPWLRRTAIETLAAIGPQGDREAALLLLKAARRDDPVLALDPDQLFEEFGQMAAQVPAELGALLLNENERVVEHAYQLLSSLGAQAAPAVPSIVQALQTRQKNGWPSGAHNLFWLLGRIGPQAQEAVPTLTDLVLRSEEEYRHTPGYGRVTVMTTLMKIGITPRALPAIRQMLASDQPTEVACAAHAVALLGHQAADTIPLLLRPLRSDFKDSFMTADFFYGYSYDTSARIEAIRALARFGPAAKEALPLLQPYAAVPEVKRVYRQVVLSQEAQQAIQAIRQSKPQDEF